MDIRVAAGCGRSSPRLGWVGARLGAVIGDLMGAVGSDDDPKGMLGNARASFRSSPAIATSSSLKASSHRP